MRAKDHYTVKAKLSGLRARSAYKLMQINRKFGLIKPMDSVLDLGCWPGGWLIVAKRCRAGRVVGVDIKSIDKIKGVEFIQGNIEDNKTLAKIKGKFDVVLSDMAPSTCGNKVIDNAVQHDLAETALKVAIQFLVPGGKFLVKVFQGEGYMQLINKVKEHFSMVKTVKPLASRKGSREMYILADGFK